jgi:hypothetical protein
VAVQENHFAFFQAQECMLWSCWISSNILMSMFENMRVSQKVMPLTFLFNNIHMIHIQKVLHA